MVWYSGGKTHRGRCDRHERQGLDLRNAGQYVHKGRIQNGPVLIKQLLERTKGAKVGLIGTNQNLIGESAVPAERTTPDALTLQRLLAQMVDAGCTYAVMEVSSHALM